MTISEFKAFLEGMNVQDAPSADEWPRIKVKIEALEVLSVSIPSNWPERIYTNNAPYVPPYTTCQVANTDPVFLGQHKVVG